MEGLSLALSCLRESDIEPFQAAEFSEIVRRNRAEKIASYDKKRNNQCAMESALKLVSLMHVVEGSFLTPLAHHQDKFTLEKFVRGFCSSLEKISGRYTGKLYIVLI